MKTNGATWKAYLESWPVDQWFDDSDETFDGVDGRDGEPSDDALVEFTCGVVYSNRDDKEGVALPRHFGKWLRGLTTETLVCQVPKDRLDQFKEFLRGIGGKATR